MSQSVYAFSPPSSQQEEVLRLLYNLLTSSRSSPQLGELLWDRGRVLLVLIQAHSMAVRLLAIKVGGGVWGGGGGGGGRREVGGGLERRERD